MSPHAASYSLLQSVLMYSHTCAHMGECSLIAAKNTWLAFIKYVGYIRPGHGEGDAPTCEWTCEVTSLTHSLSTYTIYLYYLPILCRPNRAASRRARKG